MLSPVAKNIVFGVFFLRNALLLHPRHETPDGFVLQQLLPRGEPLGQCPLIVSAVYRAVARTACRDSAVQDLVRVTFLPVTLVGGSVVRAQKDGARQNDSDAGWG